MAGCSEIVKIPLESLRPHEEISPKNFRELLLEVIADGGIHTPILIDGGSGTILDGHHRVQVAKFLGYREIAAHVVDYIGDQSIVVDAWRNDEVLGKHDILNAGISGNLMPAKTSRHRIVSQAA